MRIIPPAEGYVLPIEVQESMIADGNAVGVSGQIVQYVFGSAKRWLGIDNPLLAIERLHETCKMLPVR